MQQTVIHTWYRTIEWLAALGRLTHAANGNPITAVQYDLTSVVSDFPRKRWCATDVHRSTLGDRIIG